MTTLGYARKAVFFLAANVSYLVFTVDTITYINSCTGCLLISSNLYNVSNLANLARVVCIYIYILFYYDFTV